MWKAFDRRDIKAKPALCFKQYSPGFQPVASRKSWCSKSFPDGLIDFCGWEVHGTKDLWCHVTILTSLRTRETRTPGTTQCGTIRLAIQKLPLRSIQNGLIWLWVAYNSILNHVCDQKNHIKRYLQKKNGRFFSSSKLTSKYPSTSSKLFILQTYHVFVLDISTPQWQLWLKLDKLQP